MAWTYSGDPSSTDLDTVRFLIGDTLTADQLLSDEEIAWALTQGSVYNAAAIAARAIAAAFSRMADKAVDDLEIKYSQKSEQYVDLAVNLESKESHKALGVYCGGISEADKLSNEQDTDRVPPSFKKGMTDESSTTEDELRGLV